MLGIIGILIVLFGVFGGFAIGGGSIAVVLHALPIEGTIIVGGATGAFLLANNKETIRCTFKDIPASFKKPKWNKDDYNQLMLLMYTITKKAKNEGMMALETHVDNPGESEVFSRFPKIFEDEFAVNLVCDTFRIATMNVEDPHQVDEILEKRLEERMHENLAAARAMMVSADGLPGVGIVAAVLGVVKTMASVDQPPAILGVMIGGALVGTFLGVFLSYCLVGPIANKIKTMREQEAKFYAVIKDIIIAHLQGNPPQVAIEVGRGNIPASYQPTFFELEELISQDGSGEKETQEQQS